VYLSGVECFGISNFRMVLFVRSAILRFVFLNRLVMNVVSLPVYVKVVCVAVSVLLSEGVVGCLRVGGLCVWIGKPLLNRMLWIVSISSL
jgi:hypothetical protein